MKSFLNYYQDELLLLREKGGSFAKKHPEIASRLDVKNGESLDPHTERIIESMAFLSAKLNQKIDSNTKDLAFHILSCLYPNLINTFPPCSIVRFQTQDNVKISDKINIPIHTNLFVKSSNGTECQFRTIYPINIYPIEISDISLQKTNRKIGGIDGWALEIVIKTNSVPIEQIDLSDILFHINSDIIEDAFLIYHSIFFDQNRSVFIKIGSEYHELNPHNIVPCGFNEDETVCPVSRYTNNSLQLFQELINFKRKFMFFRILGIGELIKNSGRTDVDEFSILIDISFATDRLNQIVTKDALILNSVPIVNLFPVTSDPFRFDNTKPKYLLLADQSRDSSIEIFSISEMHIINNETKEDTLIQPYFSLDIDRDTNVTHDLFWIRSFESAELRNLKGLDTYVSLIDLKMNPHEVYADVVYAKTLCTNRFETRDIPVGSKMYIDTVESAGYFGKLLYKTANPISLFEYSTDLWRLVTQLSSTHISISKAENLWRFIKNLLSIFDADSKLKVSEFINSIVDIKTNEIVRRFGKDAWRGFTRGLEVTLITNTEENINFCHLLGCVLNRYLTSHVSINSFVELKIISQQSNKVLSKWHPDYGIREFI